MIRRTTLDIHQSNSLMRITIPYIEKCQCKEICVERYYNLSRRCNEAFIQPQIHIGHPSSSEHLVYTADAVVAVSSEQTAVGEHPVDCCRICYDIPVGNFYTRDSILRHPIDSGTVNGECNWRTSTIHRLGQNDTKRLVAVDQLSSSSR